MADKPKRKNLGNKRREQIYLKFKGKCADCGKHCVAWWQTYNGKPFRFRFEQILGENSGSPTTHEIHHIIPIERGGDNSDKNLIFLCIKCHQKRHRRMAEYHGNN